jgi:hypothetical protein
MDVVGLVWLIPRALKLAVVLFLIWIGLRLIQHFLVHT